VIRKKVDYCNMIIKKLLCSTSLFLLEQHAYFPHVVNILVCRSAPQNFQQAYSVFSKTLEHSDRKVVPVPVEVMYDVVADIDKYKEFIPYCTKSVVTSQTSKTAKARLAVGFGPIKEQYNSALLLNRPSYIKSICTDGRLFNMLDCTWKFVPGDSPQSCVVQFHIIFEFRSLMYSQLATMFFNEIVKKMVNSFESRARSNYQKHLETHHKLQ